MSSSSFIVAASFAARLEVRPAPVTLSESFAILQHLKRYGSVSSFINTKQLSIQPTVSRLPLPQSETYAVTFNNTKSSPLDSAFQRVQTRPHDQNNDEILTFNVSANTNNPNPHDIDPYNVRGLLDRKPHPNQRKFHCTLTAAPTLDSNNNNKSNNNNDDDNIDNGNKVPIQQQQQQQPQPHHTYGAEFTVDRSSIFAEIFAKANTPASLRHGLLPYKDPAYDDVDDVDEGPGREGTRRIIDNRPRNKRGIKDQHKRASDYKREFEEQYRRAVHHEQIVMMTPLDPSLTKMYHRAFLSSVLSGSVVRKVKGDVKRTGLDYQELVSQHKWSR